jgi:hypothetical protein
MTKNQSKENKFPFCGFIIQEEGRKGNLMGKIQSLSFILLVALCATVLMVGANAEAPVWDDVPDVRLLLGDVSPIDIELANYVWSSKTDVFTFTSATSLALTGTSAGTNPGTMAQNGTVTTDIVPRLTTDAFGSEDHTITAINSEGNMDEEVKVKYSKFIVTTPRFGLDNQFNDGQTEATSFRYITTGTDIMAGAYTVESYPGEPAILTTALSWSALVSRIKHNELDTQLLGADRSFNAIERANSIFPLAPRSNPVLSTSGSGIGVFVGDDGSFELTPDASFSAPVLIGIRGDGSGASAEGYDGTFIFSSPAILGAFSERWSDGAGGFVTYTGTNDIDRDFNFDSVTPGTVLGVMQLPGAGAPTSWLINTLATAADWSAVTADWQVRVSALSGLGNANLAANQFPGAASGNVMEVALGADSGLNGGTGPAGEGDFPNTKMFLFSVLDLDSEGTYTFSANVATNCAAAASSNNVPHIGIGLGTSPHFMEFGYNEISGPSIPRDGQWMAIKSTANLSGNLFNVGATGGATGSGQPEYQGGAPVFFITAPQPNNRTSAFTGCSVYIDNCRLYPSEFDLDIALGATEVPWTASVGTGDALFTNDNLAGATLRSSLYGDVEGLDGSLATVTDSFPISFPNGSVSVAVTYGTNNAVTPNMTGTNGHSLTVDPNGTPGASGYLILPFDPHSYAPTQAFQAAVYASRCFVRADATMFTIPRFDIAYLGYGTTTYVGGSDPLVAAQAHSLGIPTTSGVWRQMTVEHAFSTDTVEDISVSGGLLAHNIWFLVAVATDPADAGLNAELVGLGQNGGANIFGTAGDQSPGGAADCGKVYVDDIAHHRIDDSLAFYDDSLFAD